jgi:predicted nucleotidyltransferase
MTKRLRKRTKKMAKKPTRLSEFKTVVYSSQRWTLLQELRRKARQIMEPLDASHLEAIVHGSIARGDVSSKSDIDIFISSPSSSFAVETCLEKYNIPVNRRLVVQATPNYTMKAHIEIDENTTVTFPLMKMRKTEREFYRFGGETNLEHLKKNLRVPGVDKRLMLIEPTDKGHVESTITGREEQVAHTLGISVETVSDRVHALLRRDKIGRTGVFIKEELSEGETFEMLLEKLARKNPAVRRRLASQK